MEVTDNLHIRLIQEDELASVFQLMLQLRPHLNFENYIDIYKEARRANNYTLFGCYQGSSCLGLMGLRTMHDYVHGFHIYIDDLVVAAEHRSKGVGAQLLKHAEALAIEKKCTGLRLCTGLENQAGIRFYERENWQHRAAVYKKKI